MFTTWEHNLGFNLLLIRRRQLCCIWSLFRFSAWFARALHLSSIIHHNPTSSDIIYHQSSIIFRAKQHSKSKVIYNGHDGSCTTVEWRLEVDRHICPNILRFTMSKLSPSSPKLNEKWDWSTYILLIIKTQLQYVFFKFQHFIRLKLNIQQLPLAAVYFLCLKETPLARYHVIIISYISLKKKNQL